MPEWKAVYVKHNHEKAASRFLAARGVDHYLPLYAEQAILANRRRVVVEKPVFPGYLFVRFAPREEARFDGARCGVLNGRKRVRRNNRSRDCAVAQSGYTRRNAAAPPLAGIARVLHAWPKPGHDSRRLIFRRSRDVSGTGPGPAPVTDQTVLQPGSMRVFSHRHGATAKAWRKSAERRHLCS